jgi:hypothetical protein
MALPTVDITSSDFKARAYDYYAQLTGRTRSIPYRVHNTCVV